MCLRPVLVLLLVLLPGAHAADASLSLTRATIPELQAALAAGTVDAERLVTLGLARIDADDRAWPELGAVLTVDPRALEQARALDAERRHSGPRSPLHGIPVLLKDHLDTADLPTTTGSFLLAESVPPDDAALVRRLRNAGAIVRAKVNLSEFASGGPRSSPGGPTRNPHDPTRTPSGSSGGTGAAVGVARDFPGQDREVDWVMEAALATLAAAGATVVDVTLPEGLLESRGERYRTIRYPEFRAQLADCLATLAPGFPRTLEEVVEGNRTLLARRDDGARPDPGRWRLMLDELGSPGLDDPEYLALRDHGLPPIRTRSPASWPGRNSTPWSIRPRRSARAASTRPPTPTAPRAAAAPR